ncbi:NADH dehydrogenase [ubiquinone] iron-sulfur protein 6, mitochondrial-like [Oscarella lobularis]|uniref:NADH dehydrogenase [ubiquinone] iron-sulfur protein 6, mitochondrial-like n=1 Tax=Oscarella lobularis TaxID=121494 RepID=UPI0033139323
MAKRFLTTATSFLRVRAIATSARGIRLLSTQKVTHTGQVWDESDFRNVRFTGKEKEVNPNFAINLVDEEPPIPIKESNYWCDGGSGPLGHPKVYINLDKPGVHVCGYCGNRYVREDYWDKMQEGKMEKTLIA